MISTNNPGSTDRLRRLIESLTSSEKRAFRIASRTHGEQEKAYVRLFDLVESSKATSKEEILEAMQGYASNESIPVLRSYLYRQILRVLREHGSERAPAVRVSQMIEEIRILYRKGLYDDASIHLAKARKVAVRWEMHSYLQELAGIASSLQAQNDDAASQLSSYDERSALHEDRGELLRMNRIVGELSAELHHGPVLPDSEERERYDRILRQLPQEPPPIDAYRRRSTWHYARATHAFGTMDYDGALRETEHLIALFTAESKRVDESPDEFFRQVNNRLLLLHRLGRDEEFVRALEESRTVFGEIVSKRPSGEEPTRLNAAATLWMREALFRVDRQEHDRITEIAEEIRAYGLEEIRREQSVFWSVLFHICAIGWTMRGDLKNGLEWNQRTLAIPLTDRPEVSFAPHTLQIILHHRLGNRELVTSLLRRLPKVAPENPHFAEATNAILELVRALVQVTGSVRSRNRLTRAIANLKVVREESAGGVVFGHTPYIAIAENLPAVVRNSI